MTGKVLNAFIADEIRVEENGKITVLGLYQEVHARTRQPADMKRAMLYVTITDLDGPNYEVRLQVHDHTEKASISSVVAKIQNATSEQLHQIIVEMEGFHFPSSGEYTFNILINDEERFTTHILVTYPPSADAK